MLAMPQGSVDKPGVLPATGSRHPAGGRMSTLQERQEAQAQARIHHELATEAMKAASHVVGTISTIGHRNLGRPFLAKAVDRACELLDEARDNLRIAFEADPEAGEPWTPPEDST